MRKFWTAYIGTLILYPVLAYMLLFVIFEINALWSLVLFVIWTVIMLLYTVVVLRFGSGIEKSGSKIIVPLLNGEAVLETEDIKGIEIRKWILGRAFGYSGIRLYLKNGHKIDLLLPDALLEEAGLSART